MREIAIEFYFQLPLCSSSLLEKKLGCLGFAHCFE